MTRLLYLALARASARIRCHFPRDYFDIFEMSRRKFAKLHMLDALRRVCTTSSLSLSFLSLPLSFCLFLFFSLFARFSFSLSVYFSQTFRFAKSPRFCFTGRNLRLSPPTILGQQFSNLERACARDSQRTGARFRSLTNRMNPRSRAVRTSARVYFCRYANSTPPRTSRQPTEVLFWTLIECYACLSDDSQVEAELHMAFIRKQHKVIRKFRL